MPAAALQDIHPMLWRGSQLARATGRVVDTGYPTLSAELPGGGWPIGTLIELLLQQSGVGEMRLLRPALIVQSKKSIALLQPPQIPNALAFAYLGMNPAQVMWLRAQKSADALWSAEQVLKTGSCGALVFWQQHIRTESLRRLQLAAQSSETLFVVVRPLASAPDSSPASLRIAVRPAEGGVAIDIIKRKGPTSSQRLLVAIEPSPILLSPHTRTRRKFSDARPAVIEQTSADAESAP